MTNVKLFSKTILYFKTCLTQRPGSNIDHSNPLYFTLHPYHKYKLFFFLSKGKRLGRKLSCLSYPPWRYEFVNRWSVEHFTHRVFPNPINTHFFATGKKENLPSNMWCVFKKNAMKQMAFFKRCWALCIQKWNKIILRVSIVLWALGIGEKA